MLRALAGMATTLGGVAWVVGERTPGTPSAPGRGRAGRARPLSSRPRAREWGWCSPRGMAGEVPPLAATWVRMGVATLGMGALALGSGRLAGFSLSDLLRRAARPVLGGAVFGPFVGVWLSLVAARSPRARRRRRDLDGHHAGAHHPPVLVWHEEDRPTWRAVLGASVTVVGVALLFGSRWDRRRRGGQPRFVVSASPWVASTPCRPGTGAWRSGHSERRRIGSASRQQVGERQDVEAALGRWRQEAGEVGS